MPPLEPDDPLDPLIPPPVLPPFEPPLDPPDSYPLDPVLPPVFPVGADGPLWPSWLPNFPAEPLIPPPPDNSSWLELCSLFLSSAIAIPSQGIVAITAGLKGNACAIFPADG